MANSLGSWFGLALGIGAASFASGTGNGIREMGFGKWDWGEMKRAKI